VTEEVVVEAVTALGLKTVKEVRDHTGAGDGCTACHKALRRCLEQVVYSSPEPICSVK
jgi:bacterioferritin-associated ferredoxin